MNDIPKANFRQIQREHAQLSKRLPRIIGSKAVAFFKANFKRKGFPNRGALDRWPARNQPDYRKGGALLIKSGRLRRSISLRQANSTRVVVGTDVPYAKAHNEGADIQGTAFVPAHMRKAHKVKSHTKSVFGRKMRVPTHTRKAAKVTGHSRQMNTKIKKRQFIGHSQDLMLSIEREYTRHLKKIVNRNL